MKVLFFLGALLVHTCFSTVSHENEQVWRVYASADRKPEIQSFVDIFDLDVMSAGFNHIDILVTPQFKQVVQKQIEKLELSYDVKINNIQKIIDEQNLNRIIERQNIEPSAKIKLSMYHNIDEINEYIDELAEQVSFVTVETIGETDEKREMRMLKLSTTENNPNAMFIQCGIHAREWVSPATCLYGLDLLTQNYGEDQAITEFLDSQDVYMVVLSNPDGYSYSWTKDRMWRKNRIHVTGSACRGVDLNRNYDADGSFGGPGSSANPCSQTYHGESGFSELETSSLKDALENILSKQFVKSFYGMHSYSQMWLHPYGYTDSLPESYDDLNRVSKIAVDALKSVHGTKYVYGPVSEIIYIASGGSVDWAYAVGVPYSFTPELRDTGKHGFLLPEDQIIPTAEEFWVALFAADKAM